MIRQQSPPKAASGAAGSNHRWLAASLCLVLAAITFAVFGQTLHHEFVNYDDNVYVYDNPIVARGLTLKGAVWASTHAGIDYWHPLTWLTNMADCQVFGLWAGGHHLTSVVLHAVAAVLLFLALRELTGSLWRSAFVAAVFAIHPLRVESVAWIAERKDVLSGVFFMLTLWAYARYAHRPSRGRGVAVAVAYGLGLLGKNTLVTLPFVLLLLDWWPLHRVTLDGASGGKSGVTRLVALFGGLVKEKFPLFLLSVGSCVATMLAPVQVVEPDRIPLLERIGNAAVSYGIYLRQMVFPAGLAIPYLNPPNGLPFWQVALAFVLLAAISISVLTCWKKHPYLLVGWLWYLGMLVPTIGIVQISYHAHADRYTYLPCIGLVLAGTWAVGDWSAGWKHRRVVLGGLMTAIIGALMVCAWRQTGYWQDSETLWSHTLACTTGNYVAHNNLGSTLDKKGRVDDAISQYQQALHIRSVYVETHYNLGDALRQKGRMEEAITEYQNALQIKPDYAEAHNNLGNLLRQKGKVDEAISHFQKALEINPDYAEAHNNLGNALLQKRNPSEAVVHFQKALQIDPANPAMQNNLAWVLATCSEAALRNGDNAVELARQANALTGGENPVILHTLAAAFAEAGRFSEAVETAQHALRQAEAQSNPKLTKALQSEMKLYRAGRPFHTPAQTQ